VEGGKVDSALAGKAPGAEVDVVVARDGGMRTLKCVLDQPSVEKLKIVVAEGATPPQRSLLEGWLHGTPTGKEKDKG
jgi:hypothetical protein